MLIIHLLLHQLILIAIQLHNLCKLRLCEGLLWIKWFLYLSFPVHDQIEDAHSVRYKSLLVFERHLLLKCGCALNEVGDLAREKLLLHHFPLFLNCLGYPSVECTIVDWFLLLAFALTFSLV